MRPSKKPPAKKLQKELQLTPNKSGQPKEQHQSTKHPSADLGETDTSSSTDQELVTDDAGFHSPTPETDGTDYGLDFTDTGTRYLADTPNEQQPTVPADKVVEQPHETANEKSKAKKTINTEIPVPANGGAAVPTTNTNNAKKISSKANAGMSKRVAEKRQAQRDLKFLKMYKKLAARVDYMIPRAAFARIVREIMLSIGTDIKFITASALEALQTATEAYVQGRLEDANLLALHARRITLMAKDMELISYLRSNQR